MSRNTQAASASLARLRSNSGQTEVNPQLSMKKFIYTGIVITVIGLLVSQQKLAAQDKASAPKYEYAIVKWDGPDRLYYNLPDKFELVHLSQSGVAIPKEAQNEEFCLAYAANKMARDGWETVTLDSRRIVVRRPLAH